MREELDNELVKKYPKIFADRYGDMKTTAMCWGFECGDGWYNILDSLCSNIQSHIDWQNGQRAQLLENNAYKVRVPAFVEQVIAEQVKEKFGGLRFYYQGGDDRIFGMVRMAESWAARTCEECGNPGIIRSGGWIKTLCDKHEVERQARYKERYNETDL